MASRAVPAHDPAAEQGPLASTASGRVVALTAAEAQPPLLSAPPRVGLAATPVRRLLVWLSVFAAVVAIVLWADGGRVAGAAALHHVAASSALSAR
jgi:hypothetical protein